MIRVYTLLTWLYNFLHFRPGIMFLGRISAVCRLAFRYINSYEYECAISSLYLDLSTIKTRPIKLHPRITQSLCHSQKLRFLMVEIKF